TARQLDFAFDIECEHGVRIAQRLLHTCGVLPAGEDEPEITTAFRQWKQEFVCFRRHANVVDAIKSGSVVHTMDPAIHTASGYGNHHHARRANRSPPPQNVLTERVANQHLFEGNSFVLRTVETQGTSAQAANGTSRDLEHIHALRIHTAFGMNRPVAESERPRRRAYLVQD